MNPYQPYGQMMPGFGFRNPMYQQPAVAPQQAQALQQASVTYVTGMGPVDAAQAPFDGTPLFFYDTAADTVYIKQFDSNNGTAPVTVYRADRKATPPQYATVDMLSALEKRLEDIAGMIPQEPVRHPRTARREVDPE